MMTSVLDRNRTAIAEGYYTATCLSNNLQIGYDWFAVREMGDGLVVESKHVTFGIPMPPQEARFEIDRDWTPRRLEVKADQLFSARVEFGESETVMSVKEGPGEKEFRAPIARRRAFFLLNGGLYYPLHAVRRFRFDEARPQQFDLFPHGGVHIRRLEDASEEGRTLRQLEMKILLPGVEDALHLLVTEGGDLVRFHARNQNLLVKLEERGPSC